MDPRTDVLDRFFLQYPRVSYKRGECILPAGKTPQGVWYITSGYVRTYSITPEGAAFMLQIFKPHSFFPMTWALNDTPNTWCFEAMTTVEAHLAPREAVVGLLHKTPDLVMDLTKRLLFGLLGMQKRMEYIGLDSAYKKTILLLLYFASTFGKKRGSGIVFTVPITQREIAAWIGTTRETASIQIEALMRKGLMTYDKRFVVIPRLRALEKEIAAL